MSQPRAKGDKKRVKRTQSFQRAQVAPGLFQTLPAGVVANRTVRTKLRYQYSATASYGVANVFQQFRLNSAFDPDYTNAGSQPPYFDKFASMYNKYRVLAAKYKVSAAYASSTIPVIAAWTNTTGSAVNSVQSACCQPDADSRLVGSGEVAVIKKYISIAKIFGVEPAEVQTDSDYGASTAANPTNVAFLNIYIGNHTGTSSSTAALHVTLSLYTEWSNPVPDDMN